MAKNHTPLLILISLFSACGKEGTPPAHPHKDTKETQVTNWFYQQQLNNGLLESVEDGNAVSLYDNALGAMVFMLQNDYEKAGVI